VTERLLSSSYSSTLSLHLQLFLYKRSKFDDFLMIPYLPVIYSSPSIFFPSSKPFKTLMVWHMFFMICKSA